MFACVRWLVVLFPGLLPEVVIAPNLDIFVENMEVTMKDNVVSLECEVRLAHCMGLCMGKSFHF